MGTPGGGPGGFRKSVSGIGAKASVESTPTGALRPGGLFVPQGFDRIHVGGALSGIDTENDPDAE